MAAEKRSVLVLVLLVIAGEAVFFLPFVLPRIFRPSLLSTYHFSNLELGTAFSVYGIVAIGSYFFGGTIADRFPPKHLIASALCLTAFGGSAFLLEIKPLGLYLLYAYWGGTTIFLLWAAMIKATRSWGGSGFQGRAFGLLEGGRGLTAACIGLFALLMIPAMVGSEFLSQNLPMTKVILISSVVVFCIGLLVYFLMPDEANDQPDSSDKIVIGQVMHLLKRPAIWLNALIIVFAYIGYKITDGFSLFAHEVLGYSEIKAASVGTAALWLRPVFALLAGFAADRFSVVKIISACFMCMLIGGLVIASGCLEVYVFWTLLTMAFTLIGIYGLRGIYFALLDDLNVPKSSTGTAVGIISVLGFIPEVFIGPIMGYFLDTFPGPKGHYLVFGIIAFAALLGIITVGAMKSVLRKQKINHP